jgi:hypothetical protein
MVEHGQRPVDGSALREIDSHRARREGDKKTKRQNG